MTKIVIIQSKARARRDNFVFCRNMTVSGRRSDKKLGPGRLGVTWMPGAFAVIQLLVASLQSQSATKGARLLTLSATTPPPANRKTSQAIQLSELRLSSTYSLALN